MGTLPKEELGYRRGENRRARLVREILAEAAALRGIRPAWYRPSLRVHADAQGSLPSGHDVPRAGGLLQQVLRMARLSNTEILLSTLGVLG